MKQVNKDIMLWLADKIIAGAGKDKELSIVKEIL
jgi:hypothetical protein